MKKLRAHAVDWAQIDRFLASADKKLISAHRILAFDEEVMTTPNLFHVTTPSKPWTPPAATWM
jgi:hypothetical protein